MIYSKGYKYSLRANYSYRVVGFLSGGNDFVEIDDETLKIRRGYAWDGCIGIFDDELNMEAGLVHDALYQMCRENLLPFSSYQQADILFRDICVAKGMRTRLAHLHYMGLKATEGRYAQHRNGREVHWI